MILIAGPCVIEDKLTLEEIAINILEAIDDKNIDFYLKASCVKDNRTSVSSYTGVGFKEGLKDLLYLKNKFNIKITTDFHSAEQLRAYGKYVDLIQIPAFLAKQTSLLKEAVSQDKNIHIKKPQFIGPVETSSIIKNIEFLKHKKELIITDRGTMLGYNQTFMDPRHVPVIKKNNVKVLVDITHPNKNYPVINDRYNLSETLAMSYIASGADGFFIETHSRCQDALCDSETMYPLNLLNSLVEKSYELYSFVNNR